MLHPTYQEITDNICKTEEDKVMAQNSRFSLIVGTAKRARQIIDERNKSEQTMTTVVSANKRVVNKKVKTKKPLSQAIDELMRGEYKIEKSDDIIYYNEEGKEMVKKKKEFVEPEIDCLDIKNDDKASQKE